MERKQGMKIIFNPRHLSFCHQSSTGIWSITIHQEHQDLLCWVVSSAPLVLVSSLLWLERTLAGQAATLSTSSEAPTMGCGLWTPFSDVCSMLVISSDIVISQWLCRHQQHWQHWTGGETACLVSFSSVSIVIDMRLMTRDLHLLETCEANHHQLHDILSSLINLPMN